MEGSNLLDAWLNTGMANPYVMASTTWGSPPAQVCEVPGIPGNLTATAGRRRVTLNWSAGTPNPSGGYQIYYNQAGKLQYIASVDSATLTYQDGGLKRNTQYCYVVSAWNDFNGNGIFDAGVDTESNPSNQACAIAN